MPTLFKSVFEPCREELKKKVKVTDEHLDELVKRQILIQRNIDHILVSS